MKPQFFFLVFTLLIPFFPISVKSASLDFETIVVFPPAHEDHVRLNEKTAVHAFKEELAGPGRFQIATENFLRRKDAFQARKYLKPSDAILLGRLLDAHILISLWQNENFIQAQAVSGFDGGLLWAKAVEIDPLQTIAQQSDKVFALLAKDFVASVPFHGRVLMDPLKQKVVFENGDLSFVRVDTGKTTGLEIGDAIRLIRLRRVSQDPIFQKGGQIEVIADGKIFEKYSDQFIVLIERIQPTAKISEGDFVFIERESKRLSQFLLEQKQEKTSDQVPVWLQAELKVKEQKKTEQPLVVALTTLANILAVLFIAL